MRKGFFAVVVLLTLATSANAQIGTGKRGSFPGCPTCGVLSAIDTPTAASPSPTVPSGAFYIAGWGFECFSGAATNRVEVYYRNDDGEMVVAKTTLIKGLARMDVQRAFSGECVVPWDSGFHLYFHTPLPRGQREIYINVWRGAYYETHRRDVFVR